jgi:hypothetical protein
MFFSPRVRRYVIVAGVLASLCLVLLLSESHRARAREYLDRYVGSGGDRGPPTPKYLPKPKWTPPPVKDPFPSLSTSEPPPIPPWNVARDGMHTEYGLSFAPPLLIGFTRSWPLLLQAVVSYITAGWPADQIYVVENTGVQRANVDGKLTLQHPHYMNYSQLERLGVHIIRSPVLLTFAQLQNFYMHLSHEHDWPYYFWSHMDVLALSYEDGNDRTPPATDPAYKSVYELCLTELQSVLASDERWAHRFFAFDHLALVNREAYEEVGGWDTLIPYYMTDCDMHSRLLMHGWTQVDAFAGIITDVSTALDDLLALYRITSIEPTFTDPNPPPPEANKQKKRAADPEAELEMAPDLTTRAEGDDALAYWVKLRDTAGAMWHYKQGNRGRNTWQIGQQGGQGEPYYYPARGIAEGIDVHTEAGREVFRRKWGHRDCDLITGAGLKMEDQWLVAKDW